MAWLNIYQNLKQAMQDVIAPEMQQLHGEIKALSAEIGAINKRLDLVDMRFDAVDKRFDALDKRIDRIQEDWPRALNVHERLAALEVRLEKR